MSGCWRRITWTACIISSNHPMTAAQRGIAKGSEGSARGNRSGSSPGGVGTRSGCGGPKTTGADPRGAKPRPARLPGEPSAISAPTRLRRAAASSAWVGGGPSGAHRQQQSSPSAMNVSRHCGHCTSSIYVCTGFIVDILFATTKDTSHSTWEPNRRRGRAHGGEKSNLNP
jgi:hypothetical protein